MDSKKVEKFGRFEVGMVCKGWCNDPWVDATNYVVVFISPERDYLYATPFGDEARRLHGRRFGIVNDPRFGEKFTLRNGNTFYVWRADKSTETAEVPEGWFDYKEAQRKAQRVKSGKAAATTRSEKKVVEALAGKLTMEVAARAGHALWVKYLTKKNEAEKAAEKPAEEWVAHWRRFNASFKVTVNRGYSVKKNGRWRASVEIGWDEPCAPFRTTDGKEYTSRRHSYIVFFFADKVSNPNNEIEGDEFRALFADVLGN